MFVGVKSYMEGIMRKLTILMAIVLLLSGCARLERHVASLDRHYTEYINLEEAGNILENPVTLNQCSAETVSDINYSSKKLAEDGYLLVGEVFMNLGGPHISAAPKKHCGNIGAERVLYSATLISSTANSMTIMTPQTSYSKTTYQGQLGNYVGSSSTAFTQQVPKHINWRTNTYGIRVTYWVKGKPPIFGAYYSELTDDVIYVSETNSGAYVHTVVDDSPAFKNNIIIGDVITKVDDTVIVTPENLTNELYKKAGNEVVIQLIRKGKPKTISLTLAPPF